MDTQLFPKNEEWATGDEALDFKLTAALNKAAFSLSYDSIRAFFDQAQSVKTRVYNPHFFKNIEFVIKALLYQLNSNLPINVHFKKFISKADERQKINVSLSVTQTILSELERNKHYRYDGLLDFYLQDQPGLERNPYVKFSIPREERELEVKIIFKELRRYLEDEIENEKYNNDFFQNLKRQDVILSVDGHFEVWFYDGKIFGHLV